MKQNILKILLLITVIMPFPQHAAADVRTEIDGFVWNYEMGMGKVNGKSQFVSEAKDAGGNVLIPKSAGYQSISYADGIFSAGDYNGRALYNRNGAQILPYTRGVQVGMKIADEYVLIVMADGRQALLDPSWKLIIPLSRNYTSITPDKGRGNVFFNVVRNQRWGIADAKGREIVAPQYDGPVIHMEDEGFIFLTDDTGYNSISLDLDFDSNGNIVRRSHLIASGQIVPEDAEFPGSSTIAYAIIQTSVQETIDTPLKVEKIETVDLERNSVKVSEDKRTLTINSQYLPKPFVAKIAGMPECVVRDGMKYLDVPVNVDGRTKLTNGKKLVVSYGVTDAGVIIMVPEPVEGIMLLAVAPFLFPTDILDK